MAQDSTRPMTAQYQYHVQQAAEFEAKANLRRSRFREYMAKKNPQASREWLDRECSNDHQFKAHVANQQFHVRQATMYGLGAILEALSSNG